ncbi:MAG: hypothetical protein GWO02_17240, partial [Gammaproteobacteria bacterium]|nr:hypothetical protein [Gammaproteobacteria bacterium]
MELTAAEAWSRILERARTLLPEQTFRIWLAQTESVALSQEQLVVVAGNEFAAEWIEDKYGDLLTEIAERVFGRPLTVTIQHRSPQVGVSSALERALVGPPAAAPAPEPVASAGVPPSSVGVPAAPTIGTPLND